MKDFSDEDLMREFQAGNASAFELLFEKYRSPVFGFVCRMLGGAQSTAEDLLQEVFMKILKSKDLYDPRASFAPWLFAIARNHCLNYLRSRRYLDGRATVSIDAADEPGGSMADRLTAAPVRLAHGEREELAAALEQAIRMLPDDHREVFLLRAVQGFSHEQTAQILHMSAATVRVNYFRARQRLQQELGRLPGWEGAHHEL